MEENSSDSKGSIASTFFYQVSKPAIRILIRLGYSARNASDLIRWAYVRVFYETPEFWRHDEPTALQCSLKTGISRSEIPALLTVENAGDVEREERRNRAARILFAWTNDGDFQEDGKPLVLTVDGNPGKSFRSLVARYSADARYQNVLDDLLAVGCVQLTGSEVRIVRATYGLDGADAEKLGLAGDMVSDLLTTTEYNLFPENNANRRVQRFWWQRQVPVDMAPRMHEMIKKMGERFGRELDNALSEFSGDAQSDAQKVEVGFGIYGYQRNGERNDLNEKNADIKSN